MDNLTPLNTANPQRSKDFSKFVLFVVILIGFFASFAGGYFVNYFINKEQNPIKNNTTKVTPTPKTSPNPGDDQPSSNDSTNFLPGKHYFEDTVIMITKDKPNITLIATVTRLEGDGNYNQTSRVSFYDGESWMRKTASNITYGSGIINNSLIKNWSYNIDQSKVLKENFSGEISVDSNKINFSTGELQNEISMRSLPGYTKFMSKGNGILTLNYNKYDTYVLYTKIYSLNAEDIQFYNKPIGLTTDWLAFWDTGGNFYHIDYTDVTTPTNIYSSHKLGVLDNLNHTVSKTFQATVTRNQSTPPSSYVFALGAPIQETIKLSLINSINKAPDNAYNWYMGQVTGTVTKSDNTTVEGIGIVEYIHN